MPPVSSDRPTPPPVRCAPLWWGLALLTIALLAAGRLWWLNAHAPLNVNEGWNAGQALRLFGDGTLYPAPDALISNNYPPLSFILIGALGRAIGDMILAGQLVSLVGMTATGAAVWTLSARLADRHWAAAGATLFAAFTVTILRKYFAINDPQWLGQAAMSWALVLLMPWTGEKLRDGRVVAAAALVVTGELVKHNITAIPIAATLWLAIVDRRALLVWIATGAVLTAAACAALFAIWGRDVFLDVLFPARTYALLRLVERGGPHLLAALPGVLASRPLLAAWRRDDRMLLPMLLLAVAIPTGFVQRSGEGVAINAMFETAFALAIAASVGCSLRQVHPWRWFGIAALPAIAMIPVAGLASARELAGRDAAVNQWRPFIARLAATPGPVACDDQALCYWAGRQSAFDFFAIKQRLLTGKGDPFLAALDRGDVAMIAMRSVNPDYNANMIIPAIRARYRTVYRFGGNELLVRRGSAPPAR